MKRMTKWMIVALLLLSCPVFASEQCDQYGGTCRETCLPNEVIETAGAFIDCTNKQECCVKAATEQKQDTDARTDTEKQGSSAAPRE